LTLPALNIQPSLITPEDQSQKGVFPPKHFQLPWASIKATSGLKTKKRVSIKEPHEIQPNADIMNLS